MVSIGNEIVTPSLHIQAQFGNRYIVLKHLMYCLYQLVNCVVELFLGQDFLSWAPFV